LGIGVQHSISRYIKNMPIDISVTAAFQNVKLADIASLNSYIISVQAFKNFPFLTLYSDIGYKHTNAVFDYYIHSYESENPDNKISQRVNFDINGYNKVRASLGASLNLYVVKLNFGYTVTSPQIFTFGLGLGLIR
jgi:hypothetical protein